MDVVRAGISKSDLLDQTGHVIGIRDVSLDIKAGETFVVMGLSGSGKSTLIRHFNRLIEPTSGQILVDGADVLALSAAELRDFRRHKVSMVFQRFALLPHKTVLENVAYGLVIGGMRKTEARQKAMQQIELVGLDGFEHQYPKQLSGGMQQRVGLARALATESEVMLMDEAFSALDPLIRNDMQDQLKNLQSRLHKTIVFITHDLDEALRIGDTIAILKDGELRQVGPGPEILLNPADDYVDRFVRDVNRARVVTVGSIAEPAAALAAREATAARCGELLETNAAVVLTEEGKPRHLLTRETAANGLEEILRDISALPEAAAIDRHATLEESFPLLTGPADRVVVTNAQSEPVGAVARKAVLEAMVRHDR
ncbi:betaine/proline/choline family ABC transporter ATP-binding protein [Microbaculum marinum]|uniref:Quaternary amine transport ATP-binding protein n=2 Tax=Microbaculum marinum TaxID=1764581 RepID=A0AAW9RLW4_9HYPH